MKSQLEALEEVMKNLKILVLTVSLVLLFVIVSCSDKVTEKATTDSKNLPPYASTEELDELTKSSENIVNYKVARTLGLIEIQNFLESCSWSPSATLTETPIVIYSINDTPEYYEFHVIDNGKIAGYVTCIADKRLGDPIQYISRDRKIYNLDANTTKSLKQAKVRIYSNGYPNVSVLSDIEVKAKLATKEAIKTEEEMLEEWVNGFTDEDLAEIGATREDMKKAYYNGQKQEEERLENLWKLIDQAENDIIKTTDDMIISSANSTAKTPIYYETEVFVLESWNHPSISLGDIHGPCGPTALLQALKGFCTESELGLFDVSDYDELVKRCESIWDMSKVQPTTYSGLKKGLEKITNNKITLTYDWYCFWYGINFEHIKNELKENELPILSLRGFRTAWIADWFKDQWHYRNIIGTAERKYMENKRFLWWTWISYGSDKYYLVVDNSYDANQSTKVGVVTNSSFDSMMEKYEDDASHCKFWETASCGQLSHYPYKLK